MAHAKSDKNKKCPNVDKSNIVKESNAIARAQLLPPAESVWEERIIAQVAAFNRMDDTDFPEQPFMIGQLVDPRKHIDGRTLAAISNACDRLAGTKFKIQYSRSHYRIYAVFSYIEYNDGIISAKLNQDLKPYYLQLRREFSMRSLADFRRLSGIYSQQIYRLLCSFRGLNSTDVPIERLYFVTTAPDSFKQNFKDFRRRILEPAEKEINKKTDLNYRWEPIKQGRKVVAVRFIFDAGGAGVAAEADERTDVSGKHDELKKWQRLSNACYERHIKAGTTCKPRGGNKCTYCRTRGRMAFKDTTTTDEK